MQRYCLFSRIDLPEVSRTRVRAIMHNRGDLWEVEDFMGMSSRSRQFAWFKILEPVFQLLQRTWESAREIFADSRRASGFQLRHFPFSCIQICAATQHTE